MASFIKGAKKAKDFPQSVNEICFIGRSNVGKSSLINTLYGKIAYVGKTPGKTRMINFFDHGDYTIADLPGYGYARRSAQELVEYGEMMEDYFAKRDCLKLCVLIIDIRRTPNQDDLDMIEYLRYYHRDFIVVANKRDKFSNNQANNALRLIKETLKIEEIIDVSCLKRYHIPYLKEIIASKM